MRGRFDDPVPRDATKTARPGDATEDPLHGRQARPELQLTRGLLRTIPGRGLSRAVPPKVGDKVKTSPYLSLNDSIYRLP